MNAHVVSSLTVSNQNSAHVFHPFYAFYVSCLFHPISYSSPLDTCRIFTRVVSPTSNLHMEDNSLFAVRITSIYVGSDIYSKNEGMPCHNEKELVKTVSTLYLSQVNDSEVSKFLCLCFTQIVHAAEAAMLYVYTYVFVCVCVYTHTHI
jgi:hypothetical protein